MAPSWAPSGVKPFATSIATANQGMKSYRNGNTLDGMMYGTECRTNGRKLARYSIDGKEGSPQVISGILHPSLHRELVYTC